ncbi:hypothetical protein SN4111_06460 [Ligilactobacillus agilis]|nr:hypothetical protein SN4111_06460 [Ligilactobacillus agilis]
MSHLPFFLQLKYNGLYESFQALIIRLKKYFFTHGYSEIKIYMCYIIIRKIKKLTVRFGRSLRARNK